MIWSWSTERLVAIINQMTMPTAASSVTPIL